MDNIGDEMPAGRELDALVAEKVMGWHLDTTGYPHWAGGPDSRGMVWTTDGWKPSTDIAAAMEVLKSSARGGKKMIPLRLWLWNLHFEPQWGWDVGLHCGASVPEDGYDVEMKTQPSLALAICRAALKAVR